MNIIYILNNDNTAILRIYLNHEVVFKMTEFHLKGFLLCLAAAACGGFRWTLSQILTQKKELGLQNPIDAIFHLQPVMVIAMAPLLVGHGLLPFLTTDNLFAAPSFAILLPNSLKILAGAILAFALGLTEYLLVAKTSRYNCLRPNC